MPSLISKEEINDIIKSKTDCAYEVFLRICDISNGTSVTISHLHELYQMVYSTYVIEGEICNGGFYQFYGNSTAQEFNAMGIQGFNVIGAHKTANVLLNAYKTILEQSPVFRMEYALIGIQDAFNKANDVYDQIHIEEYDNQFYSVIEEEDITHLRINYIKKAALNGWIE